MPKTARPIRIEGNIAYVPLTKGYTAVIDAEDVLLVLGFNWCASVDRRKDGSIRSIYAARSTKRINGKQDFILMHRVISGAPDGMDTDHRDGNGLDNRRVNLRVATHAQNCQNRRISTGNTSGAKGVCFAKDTHKWQASIKVDGNPIYLGQFRCRTAAAIAYAKASTRLHGQFGRVA